MTPSSWSPLLVVSVRSSTSHPQFKYASTSFSSSVCVRPRVVASVCGRMCPRMCPRTEHRCNPCGPLFNPRRQELQRPTSSPRPRPSWRGVSTSGGKSVERARPGPSELRCNRFILNDSSNWEPSNEYEYSQVTGVGGGDLGWRQRNRIGTGQPCQDLQRHTGRAWGRSLKRRCANTPSGARPTTILGPGA